MVKIVSQTKITEKNNFYGENIDKSTIFSYVPLDYCEKFGYSKEVIKYLKRVYDCAKYIQQVLKVIRICQQDDETFIDYERDIKPYYSDMEVYKKKYIVQGKAIFKELRLLRDSSFLSIEISSYIDKKLIEISKLTEDFPKDIYNYEYINPKEIDIYYFMADDVFKLLIHELPKYITTHDYFSNIEESLLSIDIQDYLVLVGNAKGIIPENIKCEVVPYKFRKTEKQLKIMFNSIDEVVEQLNDLIDELNHLLLSNLYNQEIIYNSQQPLQKDFLNIEEMLSFLYQRDEYKIIVSIIPEFSEYFKAFFNLGYMEYKENKLNINVPLFKNSFYAFLRDNDFLVNKQIDFIRTPLSKLFGQNIENFRQDNIESSRYKIIKETLIKANVPLNK